MKKRSFLIIILTHLVNTLIYGQSKDAIREYSIDFQNVVFVTADSSYRFSHFTWKDGTFFFYQHFADSTYSDSNTYLYFSNEKNEKERYKRNFKYITGIDTIKSYIPIERVEYSKDSVINIRDELKISYILREVGEPIIANSKQSIIRFLYPCSDNSQCNSYNLLKVKFYDDSAKLYNTVLSTSNASAIKIVSKDSCQLKKRDIEVIKKEMEKVLNTPNTICRRSGNPWLLEYTHEGNYNYAIISDFCLRDAKGKWPIVHLPTLIIGIGTKRFGRNSFIFCKDSQNQAETKLPMLLPLPPVSQR